MYFKVEYLPMALSRWEHGTAGTGGVGRNSYGVLGYWSLAHTRNAEMK